MASKPKRPAGGRPADAESIAPSQVKPRDASLEDRPKTKKQKLEDLQLSFEHKPIATFDQLYGIDQIKDKVIGIMDRFKKVVDGTSTNIDWPTLICGSKGLGKTSIVEASANYSKLKLIVIPIRRLVRRPKRFELTLDMLTNHCIASQPAVILYDDLDQLRDKDELHLLVQDSLERIVNPKNKLLVFCTTSTIVDGTLGIEFYMTLKMKKPDAAARRQILKSLQASNKSLSHLSDDVIEQIAINTPSFTAVDIKRLIQIAETESRGSIECKHLNEAIDVVKQSFKSSTHLIGQRPSVTWEDIGGLPEVRGAFADYIGQIKQGHINCKYAGIILHGPPGCGKTMVAQAMANEAGLNFISIKPAELMNKFYGETEKNIQRVFSEAQEHEPCMIYFDEFDGLCGNRGNRDNLTSAIQTLLSEMDGFEGRGKSIILASTNRLEDIDPAMKRSGRLSEHIYVGLPDYNARKEILQIYSKNLAHDIDFEHWAKKTESFSGADLGFLVAKAKSKARQGAMSSEANTILTEHFESAYKLLLENRESSDKISKLVHKPKAV